eukprot:s88_g4.t1
MHEQQLQVKRIRCLDRLALLPRQAQRFQTVDQEKVYILLYVKQQPIPMDEPPAGAVVEERPGKFRKVLGGPRPDINLADSDSDVIVQKNQKEAPPASGPFQASTLQQRNKNFFNLKEEQRQEIFRILTNAATLRDALDAVAYMPEIDLQDKTSAGYISEYTLRNWFQHPDRLLKLLQAKATPRRRNNYPSQRQAPAASRRAQLSPEIENTIRTALTKASHRNLNRNEIRGQGREIRGQGREFRGQGRKFVGKVGKFVGKVGNSWARSEIRGQGREIRGQGRADVVTVTCNCLRQPL